MAVVQGVVPMLGYLRGLGVVPTPSPAVAVSETEQLHERYRCYLVQERGLAAGTIAGYLHVARLFCAARAVDDELHLDQLSAAEVTEFVLAECVSRSVGSAKYIVCGLRSLFRYLYEVIDILLLSRIVMVTTAVPGVREARYAGLFACRCARGRRGGPRALQALLDEVGA